MFDAAFQRETEQALDLGVPQRKTPPGIFAGMGTALRNFAPAAIAETSRALDAFSSTTGFNRQETKLRDDLRAQGINLPSFGQSVGQDIKRLTPDPETTGEAAQIVFGAGKVITKAGAFAALGGPVAAALGTGAVEGTVEAQRLQDEGVDSTTAAKVGAVRGVSTALGVALPVAGKTIAQTVGLVVAGGPMSFMAEQQASKMILDAADYNKIAEQYDPFDPVGLIASTLLPAAFGVAAQGGRRIRAKAAKAEADAFKPSAEEEAAARVVQTAEQVTASGLHAKGDMNAAAAHVDALEAARRQIDNGERVNVAELVQRVQDAEAARADAEAARADAEAKPGFLRTADDLVAMKRQEYPYLTPDLARALEIAKQPGAFRSAEDRIFLAGMLKQGDVPTAKAEAAPKAETPPAAEPVAAKTPAKTPESTPDGRPAPKGKAADSIELSARQIAKTLPDLPVADEITGQVTTASKLMEEADAEFQRDTADAKTFEVAVSCLLRH